MRRLSLSDTIFYNLGDCYMNAVAVLDGPCDLAVLLAEMEGVIEALPALTEQSVRVGLWTFAKRSSGRVDLTNHVSIIRDPSITSFEQLVPRMDKQRRNPIRIDGPPWRVFVLNPAEPGKETDGEPPLSALFMQVRHGMADAIRGLQILSRMGRYEPTAAHRALAARIPDVEPLEFETPITVHDPGFSLLQIPAPRHGSRRRLSERLAAVAATAGRRPGAFPQRTALARQCRPDAICPPARPAEWRRQPFEDGHRLDQGKEAEGRSASSSRASPARRICRSPNGWWRSRRDRSPG